MTSDQRPKNPRSRSPIERRSPSCRRLGFGYWEFFGRCSFNLGHYFPITNQRAANPFHAAPPPFRPAGRRAGRASRTEYPPLTSSSHGARQLVLHRRDDRADVLKDLLRGGGVGNFEAEMF